MRRRSAALIAVFGLVVACSSRVESPEKTARSVAIPTVTDTATLPASGESNRPSTPASDDGFTPVDRPAPSTHPVGGLAGPPPLVSPPRASVGIELDELLAYHTRNGLPSSVWVMRPDGSDRIDLALETGSATFPAWSPDGTHLAVVRDPDLWTVARDGTDVRQVTRLQGIGVSTGAAWSPDGSTLVFSAGKNVVDFVASTSDLYLVNADGSGLRQITFAPTPNYDPVFSPRGREIAYFHEGDGSAHVIDTTTLVDREVSPPGVAIGFPTRWSPDGHHLAMIGGYVGSDGFVHDLTLWVVDTDLGPISARALATDTLDTPWINEPWSPDGSQLAVSSCMRKSDDDVCLEWGVYIVAADGSNARYLTKGEEAAWSHDGAAIASVIRRVSPPSRAVLSVVTPTGDVFSALDVGVAYYPVWSPR